MATTITSDCISCGACEPECPNNAISQADPIYVIDPKLCTECVGFHDFEACAAVCPVDCCVTDPQNIESEDVLIARARELHKEMDFGAVFPSRFRKGEATADAPAAAPAAATAADAGTPMPAAAAKPETAAPQAALATAQAGAGAVAAVAPAAGAASAAAKAEATPNQAPAAAQPAAAPAAKPAPTPPPKAAAPAPKPAAAPAKPKKTFANELPASFEELSKQFASPAAVREKGMLGNLIIAGQPLLGALPHNEKKRLEAVAASPLFSAASSTGLNILLNALLYPLICMAIAVIVQGPPVLFSKDINMYLLVGLLIAGVEGAYRLKDGIFSLKAAGEMNFRPALYGIPLGLLIRPLLEKHSGVIRHTPIPVDGFYSPGFVEKLERERRYGNVYTMEDRGSAFLLRMEFPRVVPDVGGLALKDPVPTQMPDYDYDLALRNGEFVVKGRCPDERVRKISSSIGAFPPEFTTIIPLRERVTGFAHRFHDKVLEVLLMKDHGSYRSPGLR